MWLLVIIILTIMMARESETTTSPSTSAGTAPIGLIFKNSSLLRGFTGTYSYSIPKHTQSNKIKIQFR